MPFTTCITKVDETTIDETENLDLVMLMYNSLEYSSNYSGATGILWFSSKVKSTIFNADIVYNNNDNFKSFENKANFLRNTVADGNNGILKNASIPISLKYLSNF